MMSGSHHESSLTSTMSSIITRCWVALQTIDTMQPYSLWSKRNKKGDILKQRTITVLTMGSISNRLMATKHKQEDLKYFALRLNEHLTELGYSEKDKSHQLGSPYFSNNQNPWVTVTCQHRACMLVLSAERVAKQFQVLL